MTGNIPECLQLVEKVIDWYCIRKIASTCAVSWHVGCLHPTALNTFQILKNKRHCLLLHHVNQLSLYQVHIIFTGTFQICTSATCRVVPFCWGYKRIPAQVKVTAWVTREANNLWQDQWGTRILECGFCREFSHTKESQQVSSQFVNLVLRVGI